MPQQGKWFIADLWPPAGKEYTHHLAAAFNIAAPLSIQLEIKQELDEALQVTSLVYNSDINQIATKTDLCYKKRNTL